MCAYMQYLEQYRFTAYVTLQVCYNANFMQSYKQRIVRISRHAQQKFVL